MFDKNEIKHLHFNRSAVGPLHAAEIPQHNSLKSIWPSLLTSNAKNNLKNKIAVFF